MAGSLEGKIALVTGASRGAGKGIAEELGAQGATVYLTGRSTTPNMGPTVFGKQLPGTIGETANEVTRLGGRGIAIQCDHRDDAQVEAVFERIDQEHGRLDILVNNAFIVPSELLSGVPFWEMPLSVWDDMTEVGVRSSYVASVFAARMMIRQRSGLIANTSGPGGAWYRYTPAYGVGKAAVDRMAFDMGHELRPYNVAVVSLWLGLIRTERVHVVSAEMPQFDITKTESPRFLGRGVAALALDPSIMSMSGRVHYTAELAQHYGFTDIDGTVPASRRPEYGEPPQFFVQSRVSGALSASHDLAELPALRQRSETTRSGPGGNSSIRSSDLPNSDPYPGPPATRGRNVADAEGVRRELESTDR